MAVVGRDTIAAKLLDFPGARALHFCEIVHAAMKFSVPSPGARFLPLLCGVALPLLATAAVHAQNAGDQDASFAVGADSTGSVHALALQSNGQVLVGGGFSAFRGSPRSGVARLNPDGGLDTFNPGLAITGYNGGSPTVFALGLQADGKVIAAGQFTVLNQTAGGGVARLNADGSLDGTFNVGSGVVDNGGAVGEARAVAVLPNGQALVGGAFTHFNGAATPGLALLQVGGGVDPGFNAGGAGIVTNGYGNGVQAIAVQGDGKIVIGGGFSSYNGVAEGGVARLNADGTLDTSFNVGTGADYTVNAVAVQADGKVLAGGGFNNFDGANIAAHLVRLNTDGSLDTGYIPSTPGVFISAINTVLVQPDGTVLIGGNFLNQGGLVNSQGTGLLRLNADGTLDPSFDGSNNVGEAVALALQPDGRALVAYDEAGFAATGPGNVLRVYDVFPTPTVTIASGAKKVYESGSQGPATFIVSISAAPSKKLTVKYALKGSAVSGVDYQAVSGKVKIKPGHTSATISVAPEDRGIADGGMVTLKAALQPGTGYTVGSPSGAKDKIIDNH